MMKKRMIVLGLGLCAGGVLGAGGCAVRQNATKLDPVAPPAGPDSAMTYRSFGNTEAEYENTGVAAWSTRAPLVTKPGTPDAVRAVSEPAQFLGNVVFMPVSVAVDPPFKNQYVYREGGTPKTFSAAPPFDSTAPVDEGPIVAPVEYGRTETAEALRHSEVVDVKPGLVVDEGGKGEGVRLHGETPAPEAVPQSKPGAVEVTPSVGSGAAATTPAPAAPPVAPAPAQQEAAPAAREALPPAKPLQPLPPPNDRSPLAPSVTVEPVPEGK